MSVDFRRQAGGGVKVVYPLCAACEHIFYFNSLAVTPSILLRTPFSLHLHGMLHMGSSSCFGVVLGSVYSPLTTYLYRLGYRERVQRVGIL
ncbi:hypothetical protein EDB19DRAFT_1767402 [Suillus lakei]|nr:hypothetical protein EDB19DRAFT_1767402 [Suillus lakei]